MRDKPWLSKLLKVIPTSVHASRSRRHVEPLTLAHFAGAANEHATEAFRASLDNTLRDAAAKRGVELGVAGLIEPLFLHAVWTASRFAGCGRDEPADREVALERVKSLLDAYASDLSISNPTWHVTGDTALHAAAFMGDTRLTRQLLEHGFDPRAVNNDAQRAKTNIGSLDIKASDVGEVASNSTPVHFAVLGDVNSVKMQAEGFETFEE
eukprot:1850967-Prymnesium_polylepis.1